MPFGVVHIPSVSFPKRYGVIIFISFTCPHRCFIDCGKVISASSKLRVTSQCPNAACSGSEYHWLLKELNDDGRRWNPTAISPSMISTPMNANNIIFRKNALKSASKFALKLIARSPAGTEGFSILEFETASAPVGGNCSASVYEGIALETEFTFGCFGWQDENIPISYEFRAGKDPISYGKSATSVPTVLPAGQSTDDYQLPINIVIKNSVGVAIVNTLYVKVSSH